MDARRKEGAKRTVYEHFTDVHSPKVPRLEADIVVEFWPPKLSGEIKLRNCSVHEHREARSAFARRRSSSAFRLSACSSPPSDPFICLSVRREFARNERLRVKSLHAISAFRIAVWPAKSPATTLTRLCDVRLRTTVNDVVSSSFDATGFGYFPNSIRGYAVR